MEQCKLCGLSFERFKIIDGVKRDCHGRKKCFDCLPFGKRVYASKVGTQCKCGACGKQYLYTGRKSGSSTETCRTCYGKLTRHELKKKAVDYKGGKCQCCGYNKCLAALEFHHTDPSKKSPTYHKRFCYWGFERQKEELENCIIVCSNCHREIHSKEDWKKET